MEKIRVAELFAGYGSQRMALERLKKDYPGFDFEVVLIAEIENNALRAYQAVHGDCPNVGDVSKVDWDIQPDFDCLTYSFPCQDISNAGKQKGFAEGSGSRSSLLWECEKAIIAKKPKYLLMENVKALVSDKFMPDFQKWIDRLTELGYESAWQVLNAKDFGIPQNRERVFMVSILNSERIFHFPKKMKLEKRLKDVLEENVDEKYYLKEEQVQRIVEHCDRKVSEGCGFTNDFNDGGGYSRTIIANYGNETSTFIKEGEIE